MTCRAQRENFARKVPWPRQKNTELESAMKHSKVMEESAEDRAAQLDKQVQDQEAKDAKLGQKLQELEKTNKDLEDESAGKLGAVEAELARARQEKAKLADKLQRIKDV